MIFSDAVKGIKIKIAAKCRASRRLRFEDTKRIMSSEMCPRSFGTFEKRFPCATYFHLDLAFFRLKEMELSFQAIFLKVLKFGMKELARGQIPFRRDNEADVRRPG